MDLHHLRRAGPRRPGVGDLRLRFRELLRAHQPLLTHIGEWLGGRLSGHLTRAVPPVRVLDSLLWCDWWACWQPEGDFRLWIIPDDRDRNEYALTDEGRRLERRLANQHRS